MSLTDFIETPQGGFFFRIMAGFAELERDMIFERMKVGLDAVRAQGRRATDFGREGG